jgi:hypothetical protein
MTEIENQVFHITFKEVFTDRTVSMEINSNLTITEFINISRQTLSQQLNIYEYEIEIIKAGQRRDWFLPEEFPSLNPSSATIKEIWGLETTDLSFYIRKKNNIYPEIEFSRRQRISCGISEEMRHDSYLDNCPVCLDTTTVYRKYHCSHGICLNCYDLCRNNRIISCSLCRCY